MNYWTTLKINMPNHAANKESNSVRNYCINQQNLMIIDKIHDFKRRRRRIYKKELRKKSTTKTIVWISGQNYNNCQSN